MNSINIRIENIYNNLQNGNKSQLNEIIAIYKNEKYKNINNAILLLFILKEYYHENIFEVDFHLFNHFIMNKLILESEEYLMNIIEEKEQLKDILRDYRIMIDNNTQFEKILINKDYEENIKFLHNINIDKTIVSKKYYELSKIFEIIYPNKSKDFLMKSIDNAKGKWRIKIILSYINRLAKDNDYNSAEAFLLKSINRIENEIESVPLLYRLASIYERTSKSKALQYYKNVYKIDNAYLDIAEKINKLTKSEKGCKIINYENNNDNIHFY